MLNEDWQGGQLMLGASMLLAAALVLGVSNFVHIDQAKYAVNDIADQLPAWSLTKGYEGVRGGAGRHLRTTPLQCMGAPRPGPVCALRMSLRLRLRF
jgi:hypothetical protein